LRVSNFTLLDELARAAAATGRLTESVYIYTMILATVPDLPEDDRARIQKAVIAVPEL
jgi:hypothetical protein